MKLGLLRNAARIVISGVLITAFFPIAQADSSPEPVEPIPISINLNNMFAEPSPRTLEIVVGESEYSKKLAAEEAEKARLAAEAAAKAKAQQRAKLTVSSSNTQVANVFPRGWCTSYAASKFPVTWRGNAGQWTYAAAAQGYIVDKKPEAGALLVTWENSLNCPSCGHVAVIDKVENGIMFISEMNYVAFGVVSHRQLPVVSSLIRGVIHRK